MPASCFEAALSQSGDDLGIPRVSYSGLWYYTRDWGETGVREVLADGARAMMLEIPIAHISLGTLVLFRMAPRAIAKHVGILTAPNCFIHAYDRLGVIEEPLTTAWLRRIAFAFRFPAANPSSEKI